MSAPNLLFPGLPDYVGPMKGLFGLLHHDRLFEWSENVMERVAYVKAEKPAEEQPTRLRCMIALPSDGSWYKGYAAKRNLLYEDYEAKCKPLYEDYEARCKLLYEDYAAKRNLLDEDYAAKRNLLDEDYAAKRNLLDEDYLARCKPLYEDYEAKCAALGPEVLAFILEHIPDCPWDGTTLFPEKKP